MKNIQTMTKLDCLLELRKYAHPSWYASLTDWKLEQLRALLTFYRSGGKYPSEMVGKITRTQSLADEVCHMSGEKRLLVMIDFAIERKPSKRLCSWLRR